MMDKLQVDRLPDLIRLSLNKSNGTTPNGAIPVREAHTE